MFTNARNCLSVYVIFRCFSFIFMRNTFAYLFIIVFIYLYYVLNGIVNILKRNGC